MKKYLPIAIIGGIVLILIIWLAAGYNGMNSASLEVDESWANVQSQYQRRKDLIPNLEATVKKYAEHESKTFTAVTEARAGVDKSQQAVNSLPKEIPSDEQQMARYLQTQAEAKKALDLYINAVAEAYPDLKANENFRDLQTQLEGTENRITTARGRYTEAVRNYNTAIKKFPTLIYAGFLGFKPKPQFSAEAGAEKAPEVNFD